MGDKGVSLPSKQYIEAFSDLSRNPLVETSALNVPASIFVSLPNECSLTNFVYSNTNLTASQELRTIQRLEDLINQSSKLINQIYTWRSLGNPLITIFGRKKDDPKLSAAVRPFYDNVLKLIQGTKLFSNEACSEIARIFKNESIWSTGQYSDSLLNYICILFDRLSILDELHVVKSALTNDATFLINYINEIKTGDSEDTTNRELRIWLSTHCSIENQLVDFISGPSAGIGQDVIKNIFNIFWNHIRTTIETQNYLIPEMLYTYLRTCILLSRIYTHDGKFTVGPPPNTAADFKLPEDFIKFMVNQTNLHPLLPLIFEMSTNMADRLRSVDAFKNQSFHNASRDHHTENLTAIKAELFAALTEIPRYLSLAEQNLLQPAPLKQKKPQPAKSNFRTKSAPITVAVENDKVDISQFENTIVSSIKLLGRTKNIVREQMAIKLANPPDDKTITSTFERSIRKGYTDDELRILLQVITLWRTLHDILQNAGQTVLSTIGPYYHMIFQNMALNTLEKTLIKTKKMHDELDPILMPLRYLVSDIKKGEDISAAVTSKKTKDKEITPRKSPPSPSSITFMRIALSHFVNPGAKFGKGSSKNPISDKYLTAISKFIETTSIWCDLLEYNNLIFDVGDQSDLYFKEVQLDLNHVINFPIRASLPFILCEYALNNFMQPDLTELIFYPLGIYDDAARVAQHRLKSRLLLDEIQAEANICLKTLSTLISDFTFGSFRSYVSLRLLTAKRYEQLRKEFMDHWPGSRAYRLSTLLQQNQFFLLGQQIDMKALIIRHISAQLTEAVNSLILLPKKNGLSSMIAVSRGLEILRNTHKMLIENGLPLLPFETIISACTGSSVPDSFISIFVLVMCDAFSKAVKQCYFRTSPSRLIAPSGRHALPAYAFGELTLGKIMKAALEPSCQFISISHITEMVRILNVGEIEGFSQLVSNLFSKALEDFCTSFKTLKVETHRIIDASCMMSGQLQFDRYEGVYKFFQTDENCNNVFKCMKQLGNMLALASIIDVASGLKDVTRAEVFSYFHDGGLSNFLQVDKGHVSVALEHDLKPREKDTFPPLLARLLGLLVKTVDTNDDLFAEYSRNVLDFSTLTGFAATWSVLEFVFCLIETTRQQEEESPFEKYGEGVMFCASAFLAATNQKRMHYATSIGRRIYRVRDVDFSAQNDTKISRFCVIFELASTSLEWAYSLVIPIINYIRATNLLQ
jgi:hypothetical protein